MAGARMGSWSIELATLISARAMNQFGHRLMAMPLVLCFWVLMGDLDP